jgi:hypothetical protein
MKKMTSVAHFECELWLGSVAMKVAVWYNLWLVTIPIHPIERAFL